MCSMFSFYGVGHGLQAHRASKDARMAGNEASRARRESQNLKLQVRVLEAGLGKAMLINEALWELIRDKLNLTEDDFHGKLYEIDMRDGQLDGKNQRSNAADCPKCQRKVSKRHPACIYCGEVLDESVFNLR